MKLTLSRIHLNSALAVAGRVAGEKTTLPILRCALLAVDDQGNVRLEATNVEQHVVIRLGPALKLEEGGECAVNARALSELCAALTAGDVALEEDAKASRLMLRAGQSSYRLMLQDVESFMSPPGMEEPVVVSFAKADLARALDTTLYAMSADSTRPALATLNLRVKSVVNGAEHNDALTTFFATDTHRLAHCVMRGTHVSGNAEGSNILLPAAAAKELQRLLAGDDTVGQVTVAFDANRMQVTVDALVYYAQLVGEVAPNYGRVIPASLEYKVVLNREDLLAALRRLRLVVRANESMRDYSSWWVRDDGAGPQLVLFGTSGSGDHAEEIIDCSPVTDCPEMRKYPFAVNAAYVMQAVDGLGGDHVTVGWNSTLSAMVMSANQGDPAPLCVMMMMQFMDNYEMSGQAGVEVSTPAMRLVEQGV